MGGEPFRIVPHTADVRLRVNGGTWGAFFVNAARGLLAVCGIEEPAGPRGMHASVLLRAGTPEELLVDWFGELIYRVSAEHWAPTDIEVVAAGPRRLKAELRGARLPHGSVRTEVKSAAYHGLKVRRREDGCWTATIILDV